MFFLPKTLLVLTEHIHTEYSTCFHYQRTCSICVCELFHFFFFRKMSKGPSLAPNSIQKQFNSLWPVKVVLKLPPFDKQNKNEQEINLSLLASLSGLFKNKLNNSKMLLNEFSKLPAQKRPIDIKELAIPFDLSKEKFIFPEKIKYFLAICHNLTPKMDITLALQLIFIAEEWEAPFVLEKIKEKLLNLFKEQKYTETQILNDLIKFYNEFHSNYPNNPEIGKTVVDYVAEHFTDYLKSDFSLDFNEQFLLLVLESPYFARPPRSLFDNFIVTFVSINPKDYHHYLNKLDPFRSDLLILETAINLIQKKHLAYEFPILLDVFKMRKQNEEQQNTINEVLVLKDQIYKIKTYNEHLEQQIKQIDEEIQNLQK